MDDFQSLVDDGISCFHLLLALVEAVVDPPAPLTTPPEQRLSQLGLSFAQVWQIMMEAFDAVEDEFNVRHRRRQACNGRMDALFVSSDPPIVTQAKIMAVVSCVHTARHKFGISHLSPTDHLNHRVANVAHVSRSRAWARAVMLEYAAAPSYACR